MSLLSKQNKKGVIRLNCISDITIFEDGHLGIRAEEYMSPMNRSLRRKVDDFIHANLLKVLTDDDYTLHQIHAIWTDIMGDCDINNFTVLGEDLDDGEFYLQVSRKINGRFKYILSAYIELDEDSYEVYNQLRYGATK